MAVRALVIAMGVAACSEAPEPPKPLCDPADPSRGRVAMTTRGGGAFQHGSAVLHDNGRYVFVDEQCTYWANSPSDLWAETRTGTLDAAAAARLGETLHFHAWDDLRGDWYGGAADAGALIFDDSTHAVVCSGLCGSYGVPDEVHAMRDAFADVAQELWNSGVVAPGDLRVVVVSREPASNIPNVEWPIARPITDFMPATQNIDFGDGILEQDDEAVRTLNDLRTSFLRGDHGVFSWNMLPVTSNGNYYALYLRDTLPFEDADGIVPLTGRY